MLSGQSPLACHPCHTQCTYISPQLIHEAGENPPSVEESRVKVGLDDRASTRL